MPGTFRFLLAVAVVLCHLIHTPYYRDLGYYAVRAFFVLSGFAMTAGPERSLWFRPEAVLDQSVLETGSALSDTVFPHRARRSLLLSRSRPVHATMGMSGDGSRCRGKPQYNPASIRWSAVSLHRARMVACGRIYHVCHTLDWHGAKRSRSLHLLRQRRGLIIGSNYSPARRSQKGISHWNWRC